jgi:hypothetical protein
VSSIISRINDISKRIISLSSSYATNKEFLELCGINNHSLITDLKSSRIKVPGSEILAKIVRGTGCSGTWLLTGEGEKYPPDRPRENEAPPEDYIADFMQARRLIASIEQKPDALKESEKLLDLALQCSELTAKLLKLQREGNNGRDE